MIEGKRAGNEGAGGLRLHRGDERIRFAIDLFAGILCAEGLEGSESVGGIPCDVFPEDVIEEVRSRNDIVDVVSGLCAA